VLWLWAVGLVVGNTAGWLLAVDCGDGLPMGFFWPLATASPRSRCIANGLCTKPPRAQDRGASGCLLVAYRDISARRSSGIRIAHRHPHPAQAPAHPAPAPFPPPLDSCRPPHGDVTLKVSRASILLLQFHQLPFLLRGNHLLPWQSFREVQLRIRF
jgi:hypothetical protein